jgi:threonine/homoserine/homoserine lactone efflux protein
VAWLPALIGFTFVGALTPGPNNVLLWTSGTSFGIQASLRHVVRSGLGVGSMALVAAAGLGTLFTAVPEIGLGMKVAASSHLLYLAYQVAGARPRARCAGPAARAPPGGCVPGDQREGYGVMNAPGELVRLTL